MTCIKTKQRKPRRKETKKRKLRIDTLWRLEEWGGLKGHELKQRLLEIMANSAEGQRRFWCRVKKGEPDGCWLWIGGKANNGYGVYGIGYKEGHTCAIRPHRISYFLKHGGLSPDVDVLHKCDNTMCVNPDHLFTGNQLDNIADMVAKNRHVKGTMTRQAKLDEAKVCEIRRRRATTEVTYAQLAIEYGVHPVTISKVARGEKWKHVSPFDPLDEF